MTPLPAVRAEGLTPGVAEAYALQAVEAIDRVSTPDEAEQLLQQVRMAEQAVRIAEIGRVFEQRWTRVRLQAERKYGELLGPPEPTAGPGRGKTVTVGHGLGEARKERQRARQVAAVPEPVFNAYITEAEQPSRAGLLRAAKEPEVQPEPEIVDAQVVSESPEPQEPNGRALIFANAARRRVLDVMYKLDGHTEGLDHIDFQSLSLAMSDQDRAEFDRIAREARARLQRFRDHLKEA